jgi:ATP-dependent DNA helicase Rep
MYVGLTRARESLTLSFARNRRRYGEQVSCDPSRFLDELPRELIQWKGENEELDHEKTKERATTHLDKLRDMFG